MQCYHVHNICYFYDKEKIIKISNKFILDNVVAYYYLMNLFHNHTNVFYLNPIIQRFLTIK